MKFYMVDIRKYTKISEKMVMLECELDRVVIVTITQRSLTWTIATGRSLQ
jgi:hypothetical protein